MKLSELIDHLKIGHDIEFSYSGRAYSVTPCYDESKTKFISFVDFIKNRRTINLLMNFWHQRR